MRFVELEVHAFQGIQSAALQFGAGLNLLFGQNELGKSTLARAMRAALLLPVTSSEGAQFNSWHADVTPCVALTFMDDGERYWKVVKKFASGLNGSAELFHSKDGLSFTLETKGREVDEKLRSLLAWGIPSPGGKKAPHGLPMSFLAHTLLADQTEVDTILSKSIAQDVDDTGKVRLAKALASFAQDPLFKRVLGAAQAEVDQYFTPKGRRKGGRVSPFSDASARVKALSAELDAATKQAEESSTIEETVNRLREGRALAQGTVSEALSVLEGMRGALARSTQRVEALERLQRAKAEVAQINAQEAGLHEKDQAVQSLTEVLRLQDELCRTTDAEVKSAELGSQRAKEELAAAVAEASEHQRELRRAQLGQESAELARTIADATRRKDAAEAVVVFEQKVHAAEAALAAAERRRNAAEESASSAHAKQADAETDLGLAKARLAYGRWRAAVDASEQCETARRELTKARAEMEAKEQQARELELEAQRLESELANDKARRLDVEIVQTLEELQRGLALAEAALGGGFSLTLRGTGSVAIRASVDGSELAAGVALDGSQAIEAERTARIAVDDLFEIDIVAGAPEKRRELEKLRAQWRAEGQAALERAGLTSVVEARRALQEAGEKQGLAARHRNDAEQLRRSAASARELAASCEARLEDLRVRASDIEARELAIGSQDRNVLAAFFEQLGNTWEARAEQLHATTEQRVADCRHAVVAADRELDRATRQIEETHAALERARDETARLLEIHPSSAAPATALSKAVSLLGELEHRRQTLEVALATVDAEGSERRSRAEAALKAAEQEVTAASERQVRARDALTHTRSQLDMERGEAKALRAEFEKVDRNAARRAVEVCLHETAAFQDEPLVTEQDVGVAEARLGEAHARLEEATRDLDREAGVLTRVGGIALREEVGRLSEAVETAKLKERELEIEADSWQLLRDTLREVENEEGTHLGRALAEPVKARFLELTGGRYLGLQLDAHLTAEGVELSHTTVDGPEVLRALSVGTRNQLATLIRLSIANKLRTAVVLDDHLVHTDATRLAWFRDLLLRTALEAQVVVLTCRPQDYLQPGEALGEAATRDFAGGNLRAIDVARVVKRWEGAVGRETTTRSEEPLTSKADSKGPAGSACRAHSR